MGKQMAFTQMEIVAAVIIQNYHIEALEKYHAPTVSIVLHMKHGFKVKVSPLYWLYSSLVMQMYV